MRNLAVTFLLFVFGLHASAQERGAFVTFGDRSWAEVFDAMKGAGMNVAFLQYTEDDGYLYDSETDEFIAAAETARMPFYLGLRYSGEWDQKTPGEVTALVQRNVWLMTSFLPPKVTSSSQFRGWYMPLEVGNDPVNMKKASRLAKIASLATKPIAMSIYFNPVNDNSKTFAKHIRAAIREYDIVLLQDSVAVAAATESDLREYFGAIDRVFPNELWVVAEAFGATNSSCLVFSQQVRNATTVARNVVVYELADLLEHRAAYDGWCAATQNVQCP